MQLLKPKALGKGSLIGICAATSPFSKEKFYEGVETLKKLGFGVQFSENIFRKSGYLAGSDDERAEELNRMLADPDLAAIMFARGGYGAQRILPRLDFSGFKESPKVILGYSDLTALTSYISSHLNISCFYGPVVTGLSDHDEVTVSSMKKALTSKSPLVISSSDLVVIKKGKAAGNFVGGCLSIISSSIGTEYALKAEGCILFIEDHKERIYRYDRMLTHLKNSGLLKGVKGIIFGSMGLAPDETSSDNILWQAAEDILHDFPGPIVAGLSTGHTSPFLTLPLGVGARLIADKGTAKIEFDEGALT